jgi:hypothetical protein
LIAVALLAPPLVLLTGALESAAGPVNPSDFALINGSDVVHAVNGVNAGTPVFGGDLTPTNTSGSQNFDNDGLAATPDGRLVLVASGGGNVSVCLNVSSGSPDCDRHSVGGSYSDVDTVGITADGNLGVVNDGENLARITFDSAGNPQPGEQITLTALGATSINSLVVAPVPVAPQKYRMLVQDDNGNILVLQNVGVTGGPGVGYTEGAVMNGIGGSPEGKGGMVFSPTDNTRALVSNSSGPRLVTKLDTATPDTGTPLDYGAVSGSPCSSFGGAAVAAISSDGKIGVTACSGSGNAQVVVLSGIDTGTLNVVRFIPTNLQSVTGLAVTTNGNVVLAGQDVSGPAIDEVLKYANPTPSTIPASAVIHVPDIEPETVLAFPVVGFTPQITLTPAVAYNLPGLTHTVSAKVVSGGPVANNPVTFTITSSTFPGITATATTDANGVATFSYSRATEGVDQIVASSDIGKATFTSNTAKKTWTLGQPPTCPGLVWFFAEGTTRAGFDEFVLLFNTSDVDSNAVVTYFFADGSTPVQKPYVVPSKGRITVQTWSDVGRDKDISIRVTADHNLVTERSMYFDHDFGFGGISGSNSVVGVSEARNRWAFGEGTTLPGFQEYLTVLNPSDADANVTLTYGLEGGAPKTTVVGVPSGQRVTVNVNDAAQVGSGQTGVSVVADSDQPVLIERPLYFIAGAGFPTGAVVGSTDVYGSLPQRDWFFGEGTVLPHFDEFLTLANPDPANAISAHIDYLLENQAPIGKDVSIPAGSRITIKVYDPSDPSGIGRDVSDPVSRGVSAHIRTSAMLGMLAERPMYIQDQPIDPNIPPINDGTDKAGVASPLNQWYFAEGTTRGDFRMFYTIQNPQTTAVTAHITYFISGQAPQTKDVSLPASSRTTIQVYNGSQAGALGTADLDFGSLVQGDAPIIVERPFYENHVFPDIANAINGASVVFGLPNNCG